MTSKNPSPSAGYCGTCGRKLPPSREVDEEGNICAWNPCEFCNEKAKAQAGFMLQGVGTAGFMPQAPCVGQQALESTQPITFEQHLARLIDANKILKASANYKMVQEQQVRIGKLEAENTDLKRRLKGMTEALKNVTFTLDYEDCGTWENVLKMKQNIAQQALKDYSLPSPNNA